MLQCAIWNMSADEALPTHLLHTINHLGGMVIGAEAEGQMIGMAVAFPARHRGRWLLWSDMAGVHPDYQGLGVGFQLKQIQREWALAQGYDLIAWTYDPMRRGNANFNLHRLGAISRHYLPNFYGKMPGINAGLPSDRLEVHWALNDEQVMVTDVEITDETNLLQINNDFAPNMLQKLIHYIEIPYDLPHLRRTDLPHAIAWQQGVRKMMMRSFEEGYVAIDFVVEGHRCWYVLKRL